MQNASFETGSQFLDVPILFAKHDLANDTCTDGIAASPGIYARALGSDDNDRTSVELDVFAHDNAPRGGWRTYNFEVAEHHTYVADGVRVHNTSTVYTLDADGKIDTLIGPNGEGIEIDGAWTPSQAYHYGTVVNVDNGDGTTTPTLTAGNFVENLSVLGRSFADLIGLDGRFGLQGTFAQPNEGLVGSVHEVGLPETTRVDWSGDQDSDGVADFKDEDFSNIGNWGGDRDGDGVANWKDHNDGVGWRDNNPSGEGDTQGNGKPIILDMDGDGIEIEVDGNVSFDMDSDGFLENTAWVSPDDAFLVIDLNADGSRGAGDGKIDKTHELAFSEWIGTGGVTDLQALSLFDTLADMGGNNDGVISSADTVWSELRVWQDVNSNGFSEDGELKTLASLGFSQINLTYDDGTAYDDNRNNVSIINSSLLGTASFTRNGQVVEGGVGDVSLSFDLNGYISTDTSYGHEITTEEGSVYKYLELSKSSSANVTISSDSYNGVYGDSRDNEINARSSNIQMIIDGGAGNDRLDGGAGNDILIGGDGDDTIYAENGDDQLFGGDGSDNLQGRAGNDFIVGGDGADRLYGHTGADQLQGGYGDDRLYGDVGNDTLNGNEGRDNLYGQDGDDHLYGNGQDDYLRGGAGADFFDGGGQNDRLVGDGGADVFHFDITDDQDRILDFEDNIDTIELDGFDAMFGSWEGVKGYVAQSGSDVLFDFGNGDTLLVENTTIAQVKNDVVVVGGGAETAGSYIDNTFTGTSANEAFYGHGGSDVLTGHGGNDFLIGGSGNDRLYGGSGNDLLIGGTGDDYLRDDAGSDHIDGGSGIDALSYHGHVSGVLVDLATGENSDGDVITGIENLYGSDNGADTLRGDAQNNRIFGNTGDDQLEGRDGRDNLYGGDGDDRLFGNGQDDYLRGGEGADYFDGGGQNDRLVGDGGADVFHFDITDDQDRILDFEDNIDTIELDGFDALFSSANGAMAYALQVGNDVKFDFGGGDTLSVENATLSQVSDDLVIV